MTYTVYYSLLYKLFLFITGALAKKLMLHSAITGQQILQYQLENDVSTKVCYKC